LVVVDQSTGDPELNQSSAKRIITQIFKGQQKYFIQGRQDIPHILVYLEEAHNLLPSGSDFDTKDMWVRTAKEGAKYHIGMIMLHRKLAVFKKIY
jgi:DNA helicase HerA-like ATPase